MNSVSYKYISGPKYHLRAGIHPYDGKQLGKDVKIRECMPGRELAYPLGGHIGMPAEPVVSNGDRVNVGNLIARGTGTLSINIHASVSGVVKEITPRLTASGSVYDSIIVENDGCYKSIAYVKKKRHYMHMKKSEIRNAIKDAGIAGMGGAGFPTHVKLTPENDSRIRFVIVNGAECEPYLTSDYRIMMEWPEKIVDGLLIMLSLFDNAEGIIAIEDNKNDAIILLNEVIKRKMHSLADIYKGRIRIISLKTKYPQGAERSLVYSLTGKKLNRDMLPAEAGCIIDNVGTVAAVYDAVCFGKPCIERVITVSGDGICHPGNYLVKTGTYYDEIISAAGGLKDKCSKIICGGPMMGRALYDIRVPVTKFSSGIVCFMEDDISQQEESACIRCGRCISVCQMGLAPLMINDMAKECCECGCCTYVCPAKRRLTQSIAALKTSRKCERR